VDIQSIVSPEPKTPHEDPGEKNKVSSVRDKSHLLFDPKVKSARNHNYQPDITEIVSEFKNQDSQRSFHTITTTTIKKKKEKKF
jgi:hypothetical protein